jgi:hypothetical protein
MTTKLWTTPLRESDIVLLRKSNESNGPCELMDGPIGPMLKLVCIRNPNPAYHNKVYYCGGDTHVWMEQNVFLETYPEYDTKPKMVVSDMELDEIHAAQELMEG